MRRWNGWGEDTEHTPRTAEALGFLAFVLGLLILFS